MTTNDISILEWLDEVDMWSPPKQIHLEMEDPPSYTTINRRLRKLEANGLVEKHPETRGYYRLSEKGDRYLNDPDASKEEFIPDVTRESEDEEDDDGDRDDGDLEEGDDS